MQLNLMAGSSGMLGDETQERRENSDLMREAGKRSSQKAEGSVARRASFMPRALVLVGKFVPREI
jgi:hypothetical protein